MLYLKCIKNIFIRNDDCRQDTLALQFINLLKVIYDSVGLDCPVFPYKVIPNRTGPNLTVGGILEVVQNTKSRDGIGKSGYATLTEYFNSLFGRSDGKKFLKAKSRFLKSCAGYAIVSFLLAVKDRHNGNLLISNKGYLIHIDFGFLLGISPAHNLGFETAAFKLSGEMYELLGGSTESDEFIEFSESCVRAYLAARLYYSELIYLVYLL